MKIDNAKKGHIKNMQIKQNIWPLVLCVYFLFLNYNVETEFESRENDFSHGKANKQQQKGK